MSRRIATVAALIVAALAGVWLLFSTAPRWYGRTSPAATAAGAPSTPTPERKIKATLYYVSEDGLSLVGAERDVPFGDPIVEQARRIVEAQLETPAPAPLASAVPEGTTLRSLFISDRGDAFVDLSPEVTTRHPGGALNELFTVYVIVDALTVNLPSITRVQILIDGKETDTLAGHVDIRHPLTKSLKWLVNQAGTSAADK
jgi:spore germination protein GerM